MKTRRRRARSAASVSSSPGTCPVPCAPGTASPCPSAPGLGPGTGSEATWCHGPHAIRTVEPHCACGVSSLARLAYRIALAVQHTILQLPPSIPTLTLRTSHRAQACLAAAAYRSADATFPARDAPGTVQEDTMADEDAPSGLRDRLARQGEDALGKLAQELLENPLVNGAIARAFEARERAVQAQEAAMGALNMPSAADVERLTRRLRSVSQRLEGIEDASTAWTSGSRRRAQPGGAGRPPRRRRGPARQAHGRDLQPRRDARPSPAPVPREQERLEMDEPPAARRPRRRTPAKKRLSAAQPASAAAPTRPSSTSAALERLGVDPPPTRRPSRSLTREHARRRRPWRAATANTAPPPCRPPRRGLPPARSAVGVVEEVAGRDDAGRARRCPSRSSGEQLGVGGQHVAGAQRPARAVVARDAPRRRRASPRPAARPARRRFRPARAGARRARSAPRRRSPRSARPCRCSGSSAARRRRPRRCSPTARGCG